MWMQVAPEMCVAWKSERASRCLLFLHSFLDHIFDPGPVYLQVTGGIRAWLTWQDQFHPGDEHTGHETETHCESAAAAADDDDDPAWLKLWVLNRYDTNPVKCVSVSAMFVRNPSNQPSCVKFCTSIIITVNTSNSLLKQYSKNLNSHSFNGTAKQLRDTAVHSLET